MGSQQLCIVKAVLMHPGLYHAHITGLLLSFFFLNEPAYCTNAFLSMYTCIYHARVRSHFQPPSFDCRMAHGQSIRR